MDFRTFDEETQSPQDGSDASMSMLSTLSGGESLPEGEALRLDTGGHKAKLSTSTLAIGVVVVLGAAALFGMKLTLKASATDEATQTAINEIETFMVRLAEAEKANATGPIATPSNESEKVFEDLRQDPTAHQVPVEEVQKNPFEMVGLAKPEVKPEDKPLVGPEAFLERDMNAAKALKINTIMASGTTPMVFINNEMYRKGDTIGTTIFSVHEIEQLSIVVKSTNGNYIRLRYE